MDNVIKDVYKVFGNGLPETRSEYSAQSKKPFPVLIITKAYKSWTIFHAEYTKYCIAQRNVPVKDKVIEKKKVTYVKKDV
jgi:hypothetical protein|tara:strand:- start:542 stop:781 length:240 start_codon:yes stop_codon:yes gene_type:complete